MTPQEIETAARQRYNAVGDDFFPTAMILDLIYQASMELAIQTYCIERTFSTTSTSGTREYAYPTNALSIRRVEYDGVKVFPARLERDPKTNITESTGTPSLYAIWNNEIIFFPTPDTTSDTIKVFTYNQPQAVVLTSTLEIPDEYHLAVIDYILSSLFAKDKDIRMATYYRNIWLAAVERFKQDQAQRQRGDQFAVVVDENDYNEQPVVFL